MNQEGRDVFAYLKKEKDEESFAGKAWRKFKQDPLVPTCECHLLSHTHVLFVMFYLILYR